MATQLEKALAGTVTEEMARAAVREHVPPERVREEIACGRAVLPFNTAHAPETAAVVGRSFQTKVNANLGRSAACSSEAEETEKTRRAIELGADFVMDLSVGPDLAALREALLRAARVPLGTVPIYEALARANGSTAALTDDMLLAVIEEQARQGVDFMTLHAGLRLAHLPLALKRRMGIVSRGGAILARWMRERDRDNPLLARWDEILEICRRHDVTVSLGDGLRPGCLADASDAAQFAELDTLGELVRLCRSAGVQVMVEGPGHVPFDQIAMNMERERAVCDDAPFYVLGPVVTDIAPGYDHITSCIGATMAAYHGAALLCYVTPSEHLRLPTPDDVRAGVVAYRIAAHAADVALGRPGCREADDRMAKARMEFDWNAQFALALDGQTARAMYEQGRTGDAAPQEYCSMCGQDFCAVRATRELAAESEPHAAAAGAP